MAEVSSITRSQSYALYPALVRLGGEVCGNSSNRYLSDTEKAHRFAQAMVDVLACWQYDLAASSRRDEGGE